MSNVKWFRVIDIDGECLDELRGEPWLRRMENLPEYLENRKDITDHLPIVIIEYDQEIDKEFYDVRFDKKTNTVRFFKKPESAKPLWLLTKSGLFDISDYNNRSVDRTSTFMGELENYIDTWSYEHRQEGIINITKMFGVIKRASETKQAPRGSPKTSKRTEKARPLSVRARKRRSSALSMKRRSSLRAMKSRSLSSGPMMKSTVKGAMSPMGKKQSGSRVRGERSDPSEGMNFNKSTQDELGYYQRTTMRPLEKMSKKKNR